MQMEIYMSIKRVGVHVGFPYSAQAYLEATNAQAETFYNSCYCFEYPRFQVAYPCRVKVVSHKHA